MSDALDKIDSSLPHYEVRCFLATAQPGPEADATFARLLRLPIGKRYSSDLNAAADAMGHLKWWWHLSHLGADVTPTSPVAGIPVSNSQYYDREGKPITYHAMARGWPTTRLWKTTDRKPYPAGGAPRRRNRPDVHPAAASCLPEVRL